MGASFVCGRRVASGDGGMKRVFDVFFSCLAALILFVPMLLVAVAVRFTSKGPALYWSDRGGRNNVIFKMPKFRSMRVGTPANTCQAMDAVHPEYQSKPAFGWVKKGANINKIA